MNDTRRDSRELQDWQAAAVEAPSKSKRMPVQLANSNSSSARPNRTAQQPKEPRNSASSPVLRKHSWRDSAYKVASHVVESLIPFYSNYASFYSYRTLAQGAW